MAKDGGRAAVGIVQLAVAIVFEVGLLTFAQPCAAQEDGSFMSCHWAGQALVGIGAVLVAIGVMSLLARDDAIRLGLSLATIPLAMLAAVLPGTLIRLCMMGDMRCNAIMRPTALACGTLLCVLGVVDVVLRRRALGKVV